MVRPDLLIFGYFSVNVEFECRVVAANILLKNGMSASFDRDGSFIVAYRDGEKLKRIFDGKVSYVISEPKGIYGAFLKNRRRVGLLLGAVLVFLLFIISSDVVWDVRIEGVSVGEEEQIYRELSEAGLSVGSRWSKLDRNRVEANMLAHSDSVAWLNINRRGSVAYVTVKDKISYFEEEKPLGYANIVAARDCVIEDIRVEIGYPMVKSGESVRAGQILISGVIPTELGGGFCYAKGEIIGRYEDSISVTVERKITEKEYLEKELAECEIIFFGKDINIFKKYGQSDGECDIIEKTDDVTLGKKLPFGIRKTYLHPYKEVTRLMTDDELVSRASSMLSEQLLRFLSDKEPRRMITDAELFEGGYRMNCALVVCSDVTKIQEFKVE